MIKKHGLSEKSWLGMKCCGESCYIIEKELKNLGYNPTVYLNYRNCCIGRYIIATTFREFSSYFNRIIF